MLSLLGIISILFIIVGGYKMVLSNGNEKTFTEGRNTVTYAVIGLVVAILAYTIIVVVTNTVGSLGNQSSNSSSTQSTTTTQSQ